MFFEKMCEWWAVNDRLPRRVGVVAMLAYGATEGRICNGTWKICNLAQSVVQKNPSATVVYGTFTGSPDPEVERRCKEFLFPDAVCVGAVKSTIEECLKIRDALQSLSIDSNRILVVTGACHSRTAKLVWETYFPGTKISVVAVPGHDEIDTESPMLFARNGWAWLAVNIARHIVFYLVGVKRMEKFDLSQPVARR